MIIKAGEMEIWSDMRKFGKALKRRAQKATKPYSFSIMALGHGTGWQSPCSSVKLLRRSCIQTFMPLAP